MLLILLKTPPKKIWKKRKFHDIDSKIAEAAVARKTKMILEFNNRKSASVKCSTDKKTPDQIKVTTRFLSDKMLMFAKLSLSFEVLKTYCFPHENF